MKIIPKKKNQGNFIAILGFKKKEYFWFLIVL